MMITTVGSQHWPQTAEGRVLCLLLALYAFAVFGDVAATLSTFFIERDAANHDAQIAGARSINELRGEITALRAEVRSLIPRGGGAGAESNVRHS